MAKLQRGGGVGSGGITRLIGSSSAAQAARLAYSAGKLVVLNEGDQLRLSEALVRDPDPNYTYTRFECPIEVYNPVLQEWATNPLILFDYAIGAMIQRIGPEAAIHDSDVFYAYTGDDALTVEPASVTRRNCSRHFIVRELKKPGKDALGPEPVLALTVLLRNICEEAFVARGGSVRFSVPLINVHSVHQHAPTQDILPITDHITYRWHFLPTRESAPQPSEALAQLNNSIASIWSQVSDAGSNRGNFEQLLRNERGYLLSRGVQAFNVTAFLLGAYIDNGAAGSIGPFRWPDVTTKRAPKFDSWDAVAQTLRDGYTLSITEERVPDKEGRADLIAWLTNDLIVEMLHHYNETINSYTLPLVRLVDQTEEFRTLEVKDAARGGTLVCDVISNVPQSLRSVLKDVANTHFGLRWNRVGVFRLNVLERLTASPLRNLPRMEILGRLDTAKTLRVPVSLALPPASKNGSEIVWHVGVIPHYVSPINGAGELPVMPQQPTLTEKYLSDTLEVITRISRSGAGAPLFGIPITGAGGEFTVVGGEALALRDVPTSQAIEEAVLDAAVLAKTRDVLLWPNGGGVRAATVVFAAYLYDPTSLGLKSQEMKNVSGIPNVSITDSLVHSLLAQTGANVVKEVDFVRSSPNITLGWDSVYARPLLGLFTMNIGNPPPGDAPYASTAPETIGANASLRTASVFQPVPIDSPEVAIRKRAIRLEAAGYGALVRKMLLNRIQAASYVAGALGGNTAPLRVRYRDATALFDALHMVPRFVLRTYYSDASWWIAGASAAERQLTPYELGEGFGVFAGGAYNEVDANAASWFEACFKLYGSDTADAQVTLAALSDSALLESFLAEQANSRISVLDPLIAAYRARLQVNARNEAASDLRTAIATLNNYSSALLEAAVDVNTATIGAVLSALASNRRMLSESELESRHRRSLVGAISRRLPRLESILQLNNTAGPQAALPIDRATLRDVERAVSALLMRQSSGLSESDRRFLEGVFVQRVNRNAVSSASDDVAYEEQAPTLAPAPTPAPAPQPQPRSPSPKPVAPPSTPATPPPVVIIKPPAAVSKPTAPAPTPAPVAAKPAAVPAPAAPKVAPPAATPPAPVAPTPPEIERALRNAERASSAYQAFQKRLGELRAINDATQIQRDLFVAYAKEKRASPAVSSAMASLDDAIEQDKAQRGLFEMENTVKQVDYPGTSQMAGRTASAPRVDIFLRSLAADGSFDPTKAAAAAEAVYAALLTSLLSLTAGPVIGANSSALLASDPDWAAKLAHAAFFSREFLVANNTLPAQFVLNDPLWPTYAAYSTSTRAATLRELEVLYKTRAELEQLVASRDFVALTTAPAADPSDAKAVKRNSEAQALVSDVNASLRFVTEKAVLISDYLEAAVAELAGKLSKAMSERRLGMKTLLTLLTLGQFDIATKRGIGPRLATNPWQANLVALFSRAQSQIDAFKAELTEAVAVASTSRDRLLDFINQHHSLIGTKLGIRAEDLLAVDIVNQANIYLKRASSANNNEELEEAATIYIEELWRSKLVRDALVKLIMLSPASVPASVSTQRQAANDLCVDAAVRLEDGATLAKSMASVASLIEGVTLGTMAMPIWTRDVPVQNIEGVWASREQSARKVSAALVSVAQTLLTFMSSARAAAIADAVTAAVVEKIDASRKQKANKGRLHLSADTMARLIVGATRREPGSILANSEVAYTAALRNRWSASVRHMAALVSSNGSQSVFWDDIRVLSKDGLRNMSSTGSLRPRGVVAIENLLQLGNAGGLRFFDALNTLIRSPTMPVVTNSWLVRDRLDLWPLVGAGLTQPLGYLPIAGCIAALLRIGRLREKPPTAESLLLAKSTATIAGSDQEAVHNLSSVLSSMVALHTIEAFLAALSNATVDQAIRAVVGATGADADRPAANFRPQALRVLEFIRQYATSRIDLTINASAIDNAPSKKKAARVSKSALKQAAAVVGLPGPATAAAYVAFHEAFVAELSERLSDKSPVAGTRSLVADLRPFVSVANATPQQFARDAMLQYASFALNAYHSMGFDSDLREDVLVELLNVLDVLPRGMQTRSLQVDHLWYYFGREDTLLHAGIGSPLRFLVSESGQPQPVLRQWVSVRAIPSDVTVQFEADDDPQLRLATNVSKATWVSRQDEDRAGAPRVKGRLIALNGLDHCLLTPTPTAALAFHLHSVVSSHPLAVGAAPSAAAPAGGQPAMVSPLVASLSPAAAPASPLGAGGSPSMVSLTPPQSPLPSKSVSEKDKRDEAHRKIEVYITEAVRRMGQLEQDLASRRSLSDAERSALVRVVSDRVKVIRTEAEALKAQPDAAAIDRELDRLRSGLEREANSAETRVNTEFRAIEEQRQKALRDTAELERLVRERTSLENNLLAEI